MTHPSLDDVRSVLRKHVTGIPPFNDKLIDQVANEIDEIYKEIVRGAFKGGCEWQRNLDEKELQSSQGKVEELQTKYDGVLCLMAEQEKSSQGKGVDSLRTKEKIQEAIKKLNLKLTNGKTDHLSVKRLERLIYGLEICGRKPWRANAS